jgi:hypothetical protein
VGNSREKRRLQLLAEYEDRWEDDFVYDEEFAEGDEDFAHLAHHEEHAVPFAT